LHFRKYQVFLIFWYILFSTVNGGFMKSFGANSLFLSPEYLGDVNALAAAMVGFSIAIYFMSWNITTFILHSARLKFLATTSNPFLKYCINNGVIPLFFLLFYLFKAIVFDKYQELLPTAEIMFLIAGFIFGFSVSLAISFFYFFRFDKSIYKTFATVIHKANKRYEVVSRSKPLPIARTNMRIDWFLSADLKLRKPRDVRHYSREFLDSIFKRHHLAAMFSIFAAIFFLIIIGFFMDEPVFQIPAAASITIFFAILISVAGALALFLRNWSVPVLITVYLFVNWMYEKNIIDTKNKAYGINYSNREERPQYNRESILALAADSNASADKDNYIKILNNWKERQTSDKPVMYFINVSGGGLRSSTFVMNVMQRLDSVTNGSFMKQTMLINGSSGGMLAAAYFRELYFQRTQGVNIHLQDKKYINNISKDLLNPLFSSFVARDITSPTQRFSIGSYKYVKDRGYSFEEKFNDNTGNLLNKQLKDYEQLEKNAQVPLMFFNSVISRDGRKLLISTQPARFLMKTHTDSLSRQTIDPDIIDYVSFFKKQDPYNLRILSALRMNATFPYILPNVWLPTEPIIDVMDAGLRDNYGMETTLRFIEVFKEWLQQNTSKVVVIQIRDRQLGDWDKPFESTSVISWITKPIFLLQSNFFKIQDYYQTDQVSYAMSSSSLLKEKFELINFQYVPASKNVSASLSFHLTASEKRDIAVALNNVENKNAFDKVMRQDIRVIAKK
jgi:hypothetical protein